MGIIVVWHRKPGKQLMDAKKLWFHYYVYEFKMTNSFSQIQKAVALCFYNFLWIHSHKLHFCSQNFEFMNTKLWGCPACYVKNGLYCTMYNNFVKCFKEFSGIKFSYSINLGITVQYLINRNRKHFRENLFSRILLYNIHTLMTMDMHRYT